MKLVVVKKPKSPVAEAFRIMRTNISFSNLDKDVKTLLITSSSPGEGKTAITCNLAATMAFDGRKVLMVDADLRNPKVARKMEIPNDKGLSNVIAGHAAFDETVRKGLVANLDVLTSGPTPPNPSELLGSVRMRDFLEDMARRYDAVLIDSPPLIAVTDPAILSTLADGTLLVVESGETETGQALHSKKLLENVNAKILGVVLNKAPARVRGYYAYYYSQYYGYGEKPPAGKSHPRFKRFLKALRRLRRRVSRRG